MPYLSIGWHRAPLKRSKGGVSVLVWSRMARSTDRGAAASHQRHTGFISAEPECYHADYRHSTNDDRHQQRKKGIPTRDK